MVKKGKKTPQKSSWSISRRQLAVLSLLCALSITVGSIFFLFLWQQSSVIFSLNAAIIDQLGEDFPNPTFIENVSSTLESYGFNVKYYDYTQANVTFFKGLAKGNYGIIILRVHSALREDQPIVDFFTSEHYSEQKRYGEYSRDCDQGLLVEGILNFSEVKEYFAFTPDFVRELEGVFPKSVVFAMGCWSLNSSLMQMAQEFHEKGAIAYVGWSSMVTVSHTDNETAKLIWRLLFENKTLAKAVSEARKDMETGGSFMSYFPSSAENLTLHALIEEAKVQSASASFSLINYHNIQFIIVDRPKNAKKCVVNLRLLTA
ncbi:MAG: hypothetical protein QXX51_00630 [Candidatus Bathyarchaeia archaeon]